MDNIEYVKELIQQFESGMLTNKEFWFKLFMHCEQAVRVFCK